MSLCWMLGLRPAAPVVPCDRRLRLRRGSFVNTVFRGPAPAPHEYGIPYLGTREGGGFAQSHSRTAHTSQLFVAENTEGRRPLSRLHTAGRPRLPRTERGVNLHSVEANLRGGMEATREEQPRLDCRTDATKVVTTMLSCLVLKPPQQARV